ncbi:MAG: hypothetical protein ACXV5N_13565, partial [Halobacteriota archaeon]
LSGSEDPVRVECLVTERNGGLFEVASRPSQAATATVNMYVEDILWSTLTILKMCRTRFASVDSLS